MSITRIQASGAASNAASLGATTSGNLLVFRVGASGDVTGVNDDAGHSWLKAVDAFNSGNSQAIDIWYAIANGGTASNITAANSFGGSFCHAHAAEYNDAGGGTWTLDKTAVSDSGGAVAASFDSGSTATTTQADELLCGVECNISSLAATWTQPATGIYDDTAGGAGRAMSVADEVVVATGAYKAVGSLPSGVSNRMAAIATFKAIAAGGSPPPSEPMIFDY